MTRFVQGPGVIKGSSNKEITPPPNCSSCLLKAESGNRHLRRLKICPLPNGNRITSARISSESTLRSFKSLPLRVFNGVYRPSKHCSECNNSYTNERSHRAVCTRKEVSCIYPDPNSERGRTVVLRRVDGYFKCFRCGKTLKKDQNMKVHISQTEQHAANF